MTMQCCLNIAETGNQSQAKCNLFISAMKELAAFFTAIDTLFGPEQARRSAINWIEELDSIDWQSEDLRKSYTPLGRIPRRLRCH